MGLSCNTPRVNSVTAGAFTAVTGLDRVFPLPAFVHWFLAGALTDIYCWWPVFGSCKKGGVNLHRDAYQPLYCGAGGVMGGAAVKTIARVSNQVTI